jgi:SAM-dependent methyltransferase
MTESGRESDWRDYYERTAGRPPRRTLLKALAGFAPAPGRTAVDLGCGDGRDTIELLRQGWSVLAIDAEPAAIARLLARPELTNAAALTTQVQRFEIATWPPADLVNASFALPLCAPEHFAALWARIIASLKSGGRFSGQLFGERDTSRGDPGVTHCDRAAAMSLLTGLAVEMFEEEETDTVTPYGKAKHWHLFHIVARKG